MADLPVLVVSPERATTIPLLQSLLSGAPEVSIVVDRRSGERRNGHHRASGNGNGHHHAPGNGNGNGKGHGPGNGRGWTDSAERRSQDRRRHPALYVV